MAAVDFDDAMNESKRPRRDENAEKKKQEREDQTRERKTQQKEQNKAKNELKRNEAQCYTHIQRLEGCMLLLPKKL